MSDEIRLHEWPDTIPMTPRREPDTFCVVAGVEDWRLQDPLRRRTWTRAYGHVVVVEITLDQDPRFWSVKFARPASMAEVGPLLDKLVAGPSKVTHLGPEGWA